MPETYAGLAVIVAFGLIVAALVGAASEGLGWIRDLWHEEDPYARRVERHRAEGHEPWEVMR